MKTSKIQFASTKTYTHEEGLSCCFRQHKAKSHCRFLHGYALQVKLEFFAVELDQTNWVVDFGNLKVIKQWLKDMYDHKTIIASDDPALALFRQMHATHFAGVKLIDLRVAPHVGCEAFAAEIFDYVDRWAALEYVDRVKLLSVTVNEHGSNAAIAYNKELIVSV